MSVNLTSSDDNPFEHSVEIYEISRRALTSSGLWVRGRIDQFDFVALIFGQHADMPEFEIGSSRISKLQIKRRADSVEVAHFDRGWDISPVDSDTNSAVDYLTAGLADLASPIPSTGQ